MVNLKLPHFKVTHIPGTRSSRVVQVLEELGLPYDIKERAPGGKLPLLEVFEEDTDEPAFTIFESGAIVQFLLDTYNNGDIWVPTKGDRLEYSTYLKWFWFAECEAMEPLAQYFRHSRGWPEERRIPEVAAYSKERVKVALPGIEAQLAKHDYIAGPQFSGADIMMAGAIRGALGLQIVSADDFPHAAEYFKRLAARPTFQTAYPPLKKPTGN